MTMPGLPRVPAATKITLNEEGNIEGLFSFQKSISACLVGVIEIYLRAARESWGVTARGRRALDYNSMTNGLVAAIFAATGPLAIILAVANSAGLQNTIVNSWVFAAFFIGGFLQFFESCVPSTNSNWLDNA